ncbi:hypothetical protein LCGC14_3109920 [marine sediment metagenome]|uniref:Uncharacterized protein n=1 Tax=marine sediment metagenome TaxID=412755 RepID=A0A0F8YCT2_9ZZZZ
MTIKVCEVCYSDNKKKVEGNWRIGFVRGMKIDVCVEHKDVTKGMNRSEFNKYAIELGEKTLGKVSEQEIAEVDCN